jgi:predicted DNA-binding protein
MTKTISFRVDEDLDRRLRLEAAKQGQSRSQFMRDVLDREVTQLSEFRLALLQKLSEARKEQS